MSSFLSPRKKRALLKILSWFSTASLLLTFVILPLQPIAHADIVSLDDMGAAGMITGYGAWNGTSLAFEIWEDVSSTFQTAGELIEGLWNQAYVELGTLPTYQSLSEYYASGVLQQYPVVGNTYTEIIINETTAQALDIFWDWALTQEGFTRNEETDLLEPPVNYVPTPMKHSISWHSAGVSDFNIPAFSCTAPDNLQISSDSFPFHSVYGESVAVFAFNGGQYGATPPWNWERKAVFASPDSGSIVRLNSTNYTLSQSFYYNGETVYWTNISIRPYDNTNTPCSPFLNYDTTYSPAQEKVAWAMVYGHDYSSWLEITHPTQHLVLLPNPYAEDYVPQPVTIPTTIPYPPQYVPLPAPVPDPITGDFPEDAPSPSAVAQAVAQPMMQGAVSGELVQENPELEPEPSPVPSPGPGGDPVEVVTPFLPVQFPSFNFSLSGIWHYVVEWVGTLGSWFSMVFTIWSHLPYAIVVPVYATAVVVIVLGVYKRFFM